MSDARRDDEKNTSQTEGAKPSVGTDPQELPEDGKKKHGVKLDKEKAKQHDREKAQREESREEKAEEIKNA